MKNFFKKAISIFLCMLVCVSAFGGVLGVAVYPDGIDEEKAYNAMVGTDNLLNNVVPMLTGADLTTTVKNMLYNDGVMSNLLINLYSSLIENEREMELVGIECSTDSLAIALADYPQISNELLRVDSWAEVKLDGAQWGVKDKYSFAKALSAVLSPFNDILYMLLCGGRYEMNNLIMINGDNGYINAVVPMLKALGCTELPGQTMFTLEAQRDKNTMLQTIIVPALTVIENATISPADRLSELLPKVAYFVESGEFSACFEALMNPITSNPLVEIAVFLKILDLDSLKNVDPNQLLASLTSGEDGGFSLAEIDFEKLASCGSVTDSDFVSDKPAAFTEILRWIVDTLKLNSDDIAALLGENSEMLKGIFDKETEDIVKFIILLFNPEKPTGAQEMLYPEFKKGSVENTTKLTDKQLQKVYKEIDGLLDDFVKEGGSYSSIGSLISCSIYTNKTVNSLVTEIYKALEKEGVSEIMKLLGVDISPKGVAARLTEWGYGNIRNTLKKADSWENVNVNTLDWGFRNGSRRGFQDALVVSLRPLEPLLKVILAEGDLVILDSITIKGADGYNTAVIPILEALGCSPYSIKSYSSYKSGAYGDGVLDGILNPVLDLLDDVADKPVQTLVQKLPNIIYFMESGSLEKCIDNILLPVSSLLNRVPGVVDMELDTSKLTEKLNIETLAGDLLKETGIKIAEINIKDLASLGTAVQRESKMTIDGKKQQYTYIEADTNVIILSLLKIVAKTMKLPGNENILMGSMGGGAAANFDASSMTAQFSDMTEDQFIEWLYNLFFKERVKVEIVTGDDYSPTIIYTPEEKNNTPWFIVLGYTVACLVIGAVIFFNRKRLYN